MTPSDYDKLCVYSILPKATTKEDVQRDSQKYCR